MTLPWPEHIKVSLRSGAKAIAVLQKNSQLQAEYSQPSQMLTPCLSHNQIWLLVHAHLRIQVMWAWKSALAGKP